MRKSVPLIALFLFGLFVCSTSPVRAEPAAPKKKGAVIWKGYPNGYMNRLKSGQAGNSKEALQRSPGTNGSRSPTQRSFEIDQAEKMQELHSKVIRSLIPR